MQDQSNVRDGLIEQAWLDFGDVPMNPETEIMEEDVVLHIGEEIIRFQKGTSREEIWHWFDENYSKGVAYLLYH